MATQIVTAIVTAVEGISFDVTGAWTAEDVINHPTAFLHGTWDSYEIDGTEGEYITSSFGHVVPRS